MADPTKAGIGREADEAKAKAKAEAKPEAKPDTRPKRPQGAFLGCGSRKPPWARSRRKELDEKLRRMREGIREDD